MKSKRVFAAIFLASLAMLPLPAPAQAPAQFAADMIITPESGQGAMTGKIYFGNQKLRMDMNAGAHQMATITDMATRTSYMLMPQQKMYMEMNAAMAQQHQPDVHPYDPANPCAAREGYTCKKLGSETVNGRSCDKWEIAGPRLTETVWIDQKIHFPIKTVGPSGTTEMKNVQEGAQDPKLFEVPSDFRKMPMPMGGMMGQRPPQ